VTLYNIVNPGSLVSGQPQDVSQVLANFTAIQNVLNGNIDGANLAAGGVANSKLAGYPWANADIAAGAAIAYSKLSLAGSVVNADVAAAAAIAPSKFAGFPNDATKYLAGDGSWPVLSAGGGGALTMFYDSGAAGVVFPVASITTTSLPQTAKHLLVVWRCTSTLAGLDTMLMRVNGATTGYYGEQVTAQVSSIAAAATSNASATTIGFLGQNTGFGGGGFVFISDYAQSVYKAITCVGFGVNSVPNSSLYIGGNFSNISAAWTTLTFLPNTGPNLSTGRFTVYGLG